MNSPTVAPSLVSSRRHDLDALRAGDDVTWHPASLSDVLLFPRVDRPGCSRWRLGDRDC